MTRVQSATLFWSIIFALALTASVAIGCAPRGWDHVKLGLEAVGASLFGILAFIAFIGAIGGGYGD